MLDLRKRLHVPLSPTHPKLDATPHKAATASVIATRLILAHKLEMAVPFAVGGGGVPRVCFEIMCAAPG